MDNNKKRILIICNDREYLNELSVVLSKYKIIKKYNFINISKTIRENNPDLILINYTINWENDLEIIKTIRQKDELKYIPIVLLTSFYEKNDFNDLIDKYDLNLCLEILVKPDVLLENVDNILSSNEIFRSILNK